MNAFEEAHAEIAREQRGTRIGRENLETVREYFRSHLCATNKDCARALGLSERVVGGHVATIRAEWK